MPNCFQLFKKNSDKPSIFNDIDTELWNKFANGEPKGNTKYFVNWYDSIGMALAVGKDWDWIKEQEPDTESLGRKVIDYLADNYRSTAWYECSGFNK